MDYAGTGLNVPNATVGIVYSIGSSNPNKLKQALGRVIGRAESHAFAYLLATAGTTEPGFYTKAIEMCEVLRKCILAQAEIILPEYLVAAA